ncbi:MAG: 50S ribosome-binding GTPase, partial [Thermoguttaceae bacterium]|nr:50S ribosome-binding GTPase [Thermoguttaceae bacterium]
VELLARVGRALYAPPRVVLIGPVNAGKSSLLNALLGFDRALVDPMAGTTRDAVSAATVIDGFPLLLSDTAGVREKPGALEKEGIDRIVPLLKDARLLLTVYDVAAPEADPIGEFTRALRAAGGNLTPGEPPSLLVLNKCDLPRETRNRFWETAPAERNGLVETSVFRPESVAALQKRMIELLFPALPEPGEFVPVNARQLEAARARCR